MGKQELETIKKGRVFRSKSSRIFYICIVALPTLQFLILYIGVTFDSLMPAFKIDAFIFGPNDLAASMGHINDMYHPAVQKAIRKAVKVLSLHNKRFGVSLACTDAKKIAIWKDMGMNIFSIGADFGFLRDGALAMKAELKSLLK